MPPKCSISKRPHWLMIDEAIARDGSSRPIVSVLGRGRLFVVGTVRELREKERRGATGSSRVGPGSLS